MTSEQNALYAERERIKKRLKGVENSQKNREMDSLKGRKETKTICNLMTK